MSQDYFIFFIYILPILIGLLLGVCFWKLKKSYFMSWLMLLVGVAWWCILSHISTHGSEGPGLLAWMYSLIALTFTIVEVIKFVIRKINVRS